MPRMISSLLVVAFASAMICAHAADSSAGLVISHVTVIDTAGGPSQADRTVIVQDQRIAEVARTAALQIPAHALVVDGRGKYLIPGLWDMHVHTVFGDWLPRNDKIALPLFVANGITGVRDMGSDLDAVKEE